MSIAWFPAFTPAHPRGAAPVGALADLPVLEHGAVLLMRQWCTSAAGQQAVCDDFVLTLGDNRGLAAAHALDHLISLYLRHGRRPFMRHDETCTCIGGDESAFAQMIAAATAGDTEDAMAFALTLLPAATAFEAVRTAEGLGHSILAMARYFRAMAQLPASRLRH